ncbi:MAG: tetratricopeptide repeat protein [Planctomycetes bacterium]|nr:tetratricopeptide repeat protein [Planctomycetota bacterium]
MRRTGLKVIGCVVIVTGLIGCGEPAKTTPTASTPAGNGPVERLAAQAQAESNAAPHSFNLKLPAPPSVDAKLVEPHKGKALEDASLSFDQVIAKLPTPDYLTPAPKPAPGADVQPADAEPAPAAVKAYVLGRAAYKEGNRWQAITQLEQAQRLDPNSPQILRLLGSIYFAYGNDVKGAQRLSEAVKLDPDDGQSLFLLGRFAFQKSLWAEATVALARSAAVSQELVDPAVEYLRPYYLGQALAQQGYDAAAVTQLENYLKLPDRFARTTALLRELAFLDRQRSRVHMQVGDALCRLGKFDAAFDHYAQCNTGDDDEPIDNAQLAARRIYVLMAMGRPHSAEQALVDQLRSTGVSAPSLSLVPYVADHTANRKQFVTLVQSLYVQQDRPAPLVLALAELVDDHDAAALLADHLTAKPGDMLVFDRYASRVAEKDPAALIATVVKLIEKRPEAARDYVEALDKHKLDADKLLSLVDKLSDSDRDSAAAWYLRGAFNDAAGRVDPAAAAYDKAQTIDPAFLTPQVATIELQIRLGRYDQALALLDKVKDPNDPAIRFTRAKVLARTEKFGDALKIMDTLQAAEPRNLEYRLFRAQVERQSKDYNAAERTLWSILDLDATYEAAYVELFDLYEQNPRTDNTAWIRLMKQVQREIPASRIARLKMAEWYSANRQYDRAEQNLRSLLTEDALDMTAMAQLVGLLMETDRAPEAEKYLLDFLDKHPQVKETTPMLLLEAVSEKLGKLDQYYPRMEAFLMRQDESFDRAIKLYSLYARWKKDDKAAHWLEEAVRLKPEQAVELRMALAVVYRQADQPEKALEQLDLALASKPAKPADVLYEKAMVYHTMEKPDKAEQVLLEALKIDPDHAPSNNDLGYFYADDNRNLPQALSMTTKAVTADPENGAYLDSLGWVFYKMGRFDESRRRLEEARTKPEGNDPVILDHLGDALWRLDVKGRATDIWKQALEQANAMDVDRRPDLAKIRSGLQAKIDAVSANRPPAVASIPGEKPPPDGNK